jgi:hypothetical protein
MEGEAVASAALMLANDAALMTARSAFCRRGGGGGLPSSRIAALNLYNKTLFHLIISSLTN